VDLRNWLVSKYPRAFVQVATEKLLTYALGRGVGVTAEAWQDMPLVRAMARDAEKSGNKLSALVLGVAKSKPFQMNTKIEGGNNLTASTPTHTAGRNN
jgi:hypothetical protein